VFPKPMVDIGGRPILWHIMKHYAHYGFREFIIALGYKGEHVKRYFSEYLRLTGDLRIDLAKGTVDVDRNHDEDWIVQLVDTGLNTQTGGRVKRLEPYLKDEPFLLTYGDGVADVDLDELVQFHKARKAIATVTAVRPPARFGGIELVDDNVVAFAEKPQIGEGWINGGYMVLEPEVLELLPDDNSVLENDVLAHLAKTGELAAFRHYDFWQCMDTLRDKRLLERLWREGKSPWKVWT
jgi:glucose-1-phosphate cytidylyltransferase